MRWCRGSSMEDDRVWHASFIVSGHMAGRKHLNSFRSKKYRDASKLPYQHIRDGLTWAAHSVVDMNLLNLLWSFIHRPSGSNIFIPFLTQCATNRKSNDQFSDFSLLNRDSVYTYIYIHLDVDFLFFLSLFLNCFLPFFFSQYPWGN